MEFLLWSSSRAVLALVQFADRKVEDGTMQKNKLISPGLKRIKKWVMGSLKVEDAEAEHSPDFAEAGGTSMYLGESYQATKDPEHLPPTNTWQRSTNLLTQCSRFLSSPESGFGFRVACATLSIGIVAYLKDTQVFFTEQRLVWAMIMVAIGMTTTAGSGVFGFIGRIVGTGKFAPTSIPKVKLNVRQQSPCVQVLSYGISWMVILPECLFLFLSSSLLSSISSLSIPGLSL